MTTTATALEDLTAHAEALDPERLRQLTNEALRLLAGASTPPVPMDPDAVAALLYGYLDLSREDKRRFRAMLERADRNQAAKLGVDGAP